MLTIRGRHLIRALWRGWGGESALGLIRTGRDSRLGVRGCAGGDCNWLRLRLGSQHNGCGLRRLRRLSLLVARPQSRARISIGKLGRGLIADYLLIALEAIPAPPAE